MKAQPFHYVGNEKFISLHKERDDFCYFKRAPRVCWYFIMPGNESSLPVNTVLANTRSFYEAFVHVIFWKPDYLDATKV